MLHSLNNKRITITQNSLSTITNMNQTATNNTRSSSLFVKITRTAIKVVPWILLIRNLFYLVFGNASDGNSATSLAFSNFTGLGFSIVVQWATNSGYISA
jgi:hypothetical protein